MSSLTKDETGFGGYRNKDNSPYTFLIADGYCRDCDYDHLLEQVEHLRWSGAREGTTFYCGTCGAEHVYKEIDYQENITTASKIRHFPLTAPSEWSGFNADIISEKIDLCVEVLRHNFACEAKNIYDINLASTMLIEFNRLLENHYITTGKIGDNEVLRFPDKLQGKPKKKDILKYW